MIVSVRNSSENDPGEVAIGYFIVRGDTVTLTDERGAPLDGKEGSAKTTRLMRRSIIRFNSSARASFGHPLSEGPQLPAYSFARTVAAQIL